MIGCGGSHKAAAPAKPAPEPVTATKPAPAPEPVEPMVITTPEPAPSRPVVFSHDDKEAACLALFDHVFELLRVQMSTTKVTVPLAPAQLEKMRKQAMPMCIQKVTPQIADCVMAAGDLPQVQKCIKP